MQVLMSQSLTKQSGTDQSRSRIARMDPVRPDGRERRRTGEEFVNGGVRVVPDFGLPLVASAEVELRKEVSPQEAKT
jgi:hypothetical protein